jgi:hypothetical protein
MSFADISGHRSRGWWRCITAWPRRFSCAETLFNSVVPPPLSYVKLWHGEDSQAPLTPVGASGIMDSLKVKTPPRCYKAE